MECTDGLKLERRNLRNRNVSVLRILRHGSIRNTDISDYICILLFCPFQTFGQQDKCCVNCRIYDWGHFFMFTPMLFVNTFYGWTLFAMGTAVIVHWEYMFVKYPERFWEGSNQALKCANCKDKTCTIKRPVTRTITDFLKK